MKSSKSVCALRCAQPHMLRTWPGAPRHYPRLGRGKWLPLTHIRFAASASGGSGKRLTLLSGSAVHEKANFGGRDVALVADSYDAVAVFDAIGGWHSAGGNDFAQSLRNTVRQLLSRSEQLKHDLYTSAVSELSANDEEVEEEEEQRDDDEDLRDVLYDPSKAGEEERAIEEEFKMLDEANKEHKQATSAKGRKTMFRRYTVEQLLPREILMLAKSSLAEKQMKGVSTALLLMLSEKHEDTSELERVVRSRVVDMPVESEGTWLHSATMGDPCYLIIRNKKKFYRSTPSYAQFNEPHYLSASALSFAMDRGMKLNSVKLEQGDIVVTGTNGLFDNMWDEEIVDLVNRAIESNVDTSGSYPLEGMADPEPIANALVKQAAENSLSVEKKSPFADYAEKAGYMYVGGREDDVTAVVSFVVPR